MSNNYSTSTALTPELLSKNKTKLQALLEKSTPALQKMVPHYVTAERLLRIAVIATAHAPQAGKVHLLECSPMSLFHSIVESTLLGLELNTILQQAFLIPFRKGNQKPILNLIIGYKGYSAIAFRSEEITRITGHPVYAQDFFEYQYGSNHYVIHRPAEGEKGGLVGAYAGAFFKNGAFEFEVIDKQMAMVAKSLSPAGASSMSPWNKPKLEWTMWVKTPHRRLFNSGRIPAPLLLQQAAAIDENPIDERDPDLSSICDLLEDLENMPAKAVDAETVNPLLEKAKNRMETLRKKQQEAKSAPPPAKPKAKSPAKPVVQPPAPPTAEGFDDGDDLFN